MKILFASFFTLFFCSIILSQSIAINEIVASNSEIISDEDGDYSDFIELYNYGSTAVNLENFGLTDDEADLYQWVFPNVTIQPNEYLLVWASKKDNVYALHTSFKISSGGEAITLTHSNGSLIDQAPSTALMENTSLGRLPNGTGGFVVFQNPTPNTVNIEEILPVETPIFSQTSGFFSSTFSLNITHPDPSVSIIYTIDGSTPNVDNVGGVSYNYKNSYARLAGETTGPLLTQSYESKNYTAAITINNRSSEPNKLANIATTYHNTPFYLPTVNLKKATVVKAIAVKNGVSSKVVTHTYFVSSTDEFSTNLPIISLSLNEDELFDYDKGIYVAGVVHDTWRANNPTVDSRGDTFSNYTRRGRTAEKEAAFQYFENENLVVNQNIGLRVNGGFTRAFQLKSLRLYARSDYDINNTLNYPFFGTTDNTLYKRLILRNSGNDFKSTMFRDALIGELVKHLRFDSQDYQPAVTYVNGEYFGLLNIRERLDNDYFEQIYGIDGDDLELLGVGILPYQSEVIEGNSDHYHNLYRFIEDNDLSILSNYEEVKTKMDVDNFIDYQIAKIFVANVDWPQNNIKFYRKNTASYIKDSPKGHDGRWRWLFYDSDASFEILNKPNSSQHNSLKRAISHNKPDKIWTTLFLNKLVQNPIFRVDFANRYADLLNTTFLSTRMNNLITEMSNKISSEIPSHISRWSSIEDWNDNVSHMHNFATKRPAFARQHIIQELGFEKSINVTLNVSHHKHGYVKINTIEVKETTPGVSAEPYPWQGLYFSKIPITLEAYTKPGYQFSHWSGEVTSTDKIITIIPSDNINLKANYIPITDVSQKVIDYWVFDGSLENKTPFTSLSSSFSIQETKAVINFSSAMVGYPFNSLDPNWRKSSMERKKTPTDLNYYPEINNNVNYEDASIKGLQIKQPFQVSGKENIMNFKCSTQNHENIKVSFAIIDEGAANTLIVEYFDEETNQWVSEDLDSASYTINSTYQIFEIDFSKVVVANNNSNFQYRFRFDGADMTLDDGDRVTFNNIAILGTPIVGNVVCTKSLIKLKEDDNWTYYGFMNSTTNPDIPGTGGGFGNDTTILRYLFAIEHTPDTGNTLPFELDIQLKDLCSKSVNFISSTSENEGLFVANYFWKTILTSGSLNGHINFRFFPNNDYIDELNTKADEFKTSSSTNYISPLIYFMTDLPLIFNTSINSEAKGLSNGFKPLILSNTGLYEGENYVQFNNITNLNGKEFGILKQVTNRNENSSTINPATLKGSIRYNSKTNKYQGFNGTIWVDFN